MDRVEAFDDEKTARWWFNAVAPLLDEMLNPREAGAVERNWEVIRDTFQYRREIEPNYKAPMPYPMANPDDIKKKTGE